MKALEVSAIKGGMTCLYGHSVIKLITDEKLGYRVVSISISIGPSDRSVLIRTGVVVITVA